MSGLGPARDERAARARGERAVQAAVARAPRLVPSVPAPVSPGSYAVAGWWECLCTVAAWTPVWKSWVPVLSHVGITAEIGVVTDAAADGDLRFRITGSGLDATTNTLTIPGGFAATIGLDWLHGQEPWRFEGVTFSLEAYVRAAGGGFGVFSPYAGAFVMNDGHRCSATAGLHF